MQKFQNLQQSRSYLAELVLNIRVRILEVLEFLISESKGGKNFGNIEMFGIFGIVENSGKLGGGFLEISELNLEEVIVTHPLTDHA